MEERRTITWVKQKRENDLQLPSVTSTVMGDSFLLLDSPFGYLLFVLITCWCHWSYFSSIAWLVETQGRGEDTNKEKSVHDLMCLSRDMHR